MNLTGRSYFLLILTTTVGILGQWQGAPMNRYWLLFALLLFLGLLLEYLFVRKLELVSERRVATRAHLGRELYGNIHLRNHSGHTVVGTCEDDYPPGLAGERRPRHWRVGADSEHSLPFSITPQALGQFQWNNLYAQILGLFGLAWWSRRLPSQAELRVVPDRLHGGQARVGNQKRGEQQHHKSGAGLELLTLREYRPGDALRHIDWKASARARKHIVRLFGEEQHLELVIGIDAGRHSQLQAGKLTRLNHYINIAARLAEKAVHNGDQVTVTIYSDAPMHTITAIKSLSDLPRLRGLLETVRTQPVETNPLAAVLNMRAHVRHRSMMLLLTDLDSGDADGQLGKALNLLMPKHLPVVASIIDEEIATMEQQRAQHWLDPYYQLAAAESAATSRHLALRIQSLGGHVVQARPAHMDHAILHYYELLRQRRSI